MISVAEFFFYYIWTSVVIASALIGGLILAVIALFYFSPEKGRELLQACVQQLAANYAAERRNQNQNQNPAPRPDFGNLVFEPDEPPALPEKKTCESCGGEFRMDSETCSECDRIMAVLDDLSQLPENSEITLYNRNYSLANMDSMQRYLDKRYVGMGHRLKPRFEILGSVERGNVRTSVTCVELFVGDGSATKSALKAE